MKIILRNIYTFEHCNPHKVRIVFKGNVTDKSIKTHNLCANLNVHRCITATFLCSPALLFLILVIIEILFELYLGIREEIMVYLIAIIIILFFVWLLNYLCAKGYAMVSWTFVLLP